MFRGISQCYNFLHKKAKGQKPFIMNLYDCIIHHLYAKTQTVLTSSNSFKTCCCAFFKGSPTAFLICGIVQESAWECVTKLGENVTGRQKEWKKMWDRYRDSERQQERERDWDFEGKCDLFWVFLAACSICPPDREGEWRALAGIESAD